MMDSKFGFVFFVHFMLCLSTVASRSFETDRGSRDDDQDEMSNEVGHVGTELLGYKKDHDNMPSSRCGYVAFYAYLSLGVVTMNNYQQLVFDAVVYNSGGGYNKHTGAFTAPECGTYIFSFQFENWQDSFDQRAHLYVEGNIMASSILIGNGRSVQAGTTAVIQLKKGWVVYVKVQRGRVYGTARDRFTTFTGAHLH